jgi:ketosteroid isomerase-like protein
VTSVDLIVALIRRYALALDEGDWETVASCVSADVRAMSTSTNEGARGVNELIAALKGEGELDTRTQRFLGQTLVDVDGERATATTYAHEHRASGDGSTVYAIATVYHDELALIEDEWRIHVHSVDVVWDDELVSRPRR